jgi:hypothetical protein
LLPRRWGKTTQHATHVYTRVNLAPVTAALESATAAMLATNKPVPVKKQRGKRTA